MNTTGAVVVITGATGGIGRALAHRFAAEGATLVLTGRDTTAGDALAAELRRGGRSAEFLTADLRDDDHVRRLAEDVRHLHGRIDSLILNAGAITFGSTCEMDVADFDEMMAVNVRAPWLCVRALHNLLTDGATIVVTASVSSYVLFPGEGVYCMSKAALIPLVHVLALELAPRGIRVNALSPGIVGEAGISHQALTISSDPVAEQRRNDGMTPLGRTATMTEIADGAVFLAGRHSSFMTGQNLVLDGGLTIPRVGGTSS